MMLLHHTFLLRLYCAGDEQCLFPPYMMLYLELRFIRPEIIVSHSPRESLRYLCVCVCIPSGFSCVFTEERVESDHSAIKPRSVEF